MVTAGLFLYCGLRWVLVWVCRVIVLGGLDCFAAALWLYYVGYGCVGFVNGLLFGLRNVVVFVYLVLRWVCVCFV